MPDSEKDTPTKPENTDPLLPVFARLEQKIDILTAMVKAFFDELNEQRAKVADLDERISMELGDGQ